MGTSKTWFVSLAGCLFLFAGCASAPYKPAGFTDKDMTKKQNDLRLTCETVRMGTPVQIKFYEGNINPKETAPGGKLTGYFYACNKWNHTISVSQMPLTWRDRGEPYYLQYVDAITPLQQTALLPTPSDVSKTNPLQKMLTVDPSDPERQLLTK